MTIVKAETSQLKRSSD